MRPKLMPHILVPQHAHLGGEVLAVRAQQPAVQRDGREEVEPGGAAGGEGVVGGCCCGVGG